MYVLLSRCRGFKTLTLWVYQPLLRELFKLATAEVESECGDTIAVFFQVFNKALQEITKDHSYKFNPRGWIFDEHGGNWNAIRDVFGENALARCKSCDFHFKDCRNRHRNKLTSEEEKEMFTSFTDKLLYSASTAAYNSALEDLMVFVSTNERKHLKFWVEWWHTRRYHIFRAWCPKGAPSTNLAEIGHSRWSKQGSENLDLVTAAKEDVAESILQQQAVQQFQKGTYCVGNGPSLIQRKEKSCRDQVKAAHEYGQTFIDNSDIAGKEVQRNAFGVFTDPTSSHRADKTTNEKRGARYRKERSQSFQRALNIAKGQRFNVIASSTTSDTCHTYELSKSEGKEYKVKICQQPECEDKNGRCCYTARGNICSHIIWVYLNILKINEGDSRLHQIALTTSEVRSILSTTKKTGKSNVSATFGWRLERVKKQRGTLPKCKGCSKQLIQGTAVVAVDGLYSPEAKTKEGKSFDVPAVFRFCMKRGCVSKKPPRSNITVPPSQILWKSELVLSGPELEEAEALPLVYI